MRTQRHPDLPCAGCGRLLYRSERSLPAGKALCWTCRRSKPQPEGVRPNGSRWRLLRAQVLAEETHCGFCGEEVDKALKTPRRLAASIDHIIPVSQGGSHDRSNLRLAHIGCNARAGQSLAALASTDRIALLRAGLWMAARL